MCDFSTSFSTYKKCCDYLTKSLNTTLLSLTFFTKYNARKKIIQCTIYSSDDCNECQLQNSSPAVGLLVYQLCWLWLFFSNIYYYLYLIDANNVIWGNFWVLFNPFVMQYFVSCTKWYNYVKSTTIYLPRLRSYCILFIVMVWCPNNITSIQNIQNYNF